MRRELFGVHSDPPSGRPSRIEYASGLFGSEGDSFDERIDLIRKPACGNLWDDFAHDEVDVAVSVSGELVRYRVSRQQRGPHRHGQPAPEFARHAQHPALGLEIEPIPGLDLDGRHPGPRQRGQPTRGRCEQLVRTGLTGLTHRGANTAPSGRDLFVSLASEQALELIGPRTTKDGVCVAVDQAGGEPPTTTPMLDRPFTPRRVQILFPSDPRNDSVPHADRAAFDNPVRPFTLGHGRHVYVGPDGIEGSGHGSVGWGTWWHARAGEGSLGPDRESSIVKSWLAQNVLLPEGWAENVRLTVADDGVIASLESLGSTDPSASPTANAATDERLEGWVVPTVPNLHSHAFQRGIVGRTERQGHSGQDDFWTWRETMYDFVGRLGPDDVEAIARLAYAEMLRFGYGAVVEFHYLHHAADGTRYDDPFELSRRLAAAAAAVGIRLTLVPVVYERSGFDDGPLGPAQRRFAMTADDVLKSVEELRSTSDPARLKVGVGVHSLRAARPESLRAIAEWAQSNADAVVHLHIAEQPAEVSACLATHGARPVEWLLANAPVDERWCAVHATHMSPSERDGLAASGAVAGLCPTTEADLGDGVFDLAGYESAGGVWGIGSDSQVSCAPADELRTLEYGQRLTRGTRIVAGRGTGAARTNGRALFDGSTVTGPQTTGHRIGRIEVGAAADLVVLDAGHARFAGLVGDQVLDAWILGAAHDAVDRVAVGGEWVVRDGVPRSWDQCVAGYDHALRSLMGV